MLPLNAPTSLISCITVIVGTIINEPSYIVLKYQSYSFNFILITSSLQVYHQKKIHIQLSLMTEYCIKWNLFVIYVLFKLIWQNDERCEFQ